MISRWLVVAGVLAGCSEPGASPAADAGAAAPASARRLLDPSFTLTGDSSTGCSNQQPPSGDGHRWCAFSRGAAAAAELWVVDVSRAASGPAPHCDGSDPGCLRLTSRLWTGGSLDGPVHPYAHAFSGDTLVFYAEALSAPQQLHRGPVWAWRPGWSQARKISSDRGVMCWVHPRAPLAHCLEDAAGTPKAPDSFELRAGPIADGENTLASLGRITNLRGDGQRGWQLGWAPQGQAFAFSAPAADGTETLRVVATAELGRTAPSEILRGVRSWQIGNDGRRVYFFREEAPEVAALHAADFPSGANVSRLGGPITDYLVLGPSERDEGVAFFTRLTDTQGAFRLLRDPTASATTVFTYDDAPEGVHLSPDLRFTAWTNADFQVRVVDNRDLGDCALNMRPGQPAYSPAFLDGSGLVFWTEGDGGDRDRRDAFFADPRGCRGKQRFARGVQFVAPIGDRGIVYADELEGESQRGTLEVAPMQGWPTAPLAIRSGIDAPSVIPAGWSPLYLLFTVSKSGPDDDGTYVYGPVPF
jgi:hypothetical protein